MNIVRCKKKKKGRKWSPVMSFSQINTSNERMRHRDSPAGLWSLRAVSISQRRTGKSRTSRRGVEPHTRRQCQHLEDTGTRSRVTHRLHWLILLKRNGGHWAAMVEKWEAGVCWNNNWLAQVKKKSTQPHRAWWKKSHHALATHWIARRIGLKSLSAADLSAVTNVYPHAAHQLLCPDSEVDVSARWRPE